jgi:predicted molibdopterin-dependent oxidoreductase YjgC
VTSDLSDWATNCPEYKVTAVEVAKVTSLESQRVKAGAERAAGREREIAVSAMAEEA